MGRAVINVKTDPKVKSEAQKAASELGLTLSAVINGYLREFLKTKTAHFSAQPQKDKKLPFGIFSGVEISEKDIDDITSSLEETANELA